MAGNDNNDNNSSTEKEQEEKTKEDPNLVSKGYSAPTKIRPKKKFL